MRRSYAVLITSIVLITFASGQQPKLQNAKLQTASASSGLEPTVNAFLQKQSGPAWIGYSIPVERKERTMCCFDSYERFNVAGNCCAGCRLDREGTTFSGSISGPDCGPLEPADYAFVMLRSENQKITRVRTFTPDCVLDAAGLPVYWITDVNPKQSIELLSHIVEASIADDSYRTKDFGNRALHAIALHNIPEADSTLQKYIRTDQPERLREHAALMLGLERGKAGLETLRAAIRQDTNESFRRKALIGIAESDQPDAVKELVSLARNDSSPQVRSQALFWLAQKGGRKEAEQITDSIQNDPDTEVKRKAVFALSQMPKEEGVPLLIQVAKTNKNPVVRREAVRWLGFSNDPRAVDFLEQILTK